MCERECPDERKDTRDHRSLPHRGDAGSDDHDRAAGVRRVVADIELSRELGLQFGETRVFDQIVEAMRIVGNVIQFFGGAVLIFLGHRLRVGVPGFLGSAEFLDLTGRIGGPTGISRGPWREWGKVSLGVNPSGVQMGTIGLRCTPSAARLDSTDTR